MFSYSAGGLAVAVHEKAARPWEVLSPVSYQHLSLFFVFFPVLSHSCFSKCNTSIKSLPGMTIREFISQDGASVLA